MKQLTYTEWRKTPYAGTDTRDPDRDLAMLLDRYGVKQRQWTEDDGPGGRPMIQLRFSLRGKVYRLSFEVLNVKGGEDKPGHAKLVAQAKRIMFWTLKPLLEATVVWGPAERLLLGFLEAQDGSTVYENIEPHLATMNGKLLGMTAAKVQLPSPGQEQSR